jgi:homoserine kinase
MKDAVYNLSHTAFLLKALEAGDPELIRLAARDRLHQDARFKLIPGAAALKERMEQAGAAACCLSGAGPTMLCLYTGDDFLIKAMEAARTGFPRFDPRPLNLCGEGAVVLKA